MDRQDLDGIWTVLGTSVPTTGVAVAPTGYEVVAGQVLAGVDSDGRRHLLIPLLPGEPARTDTKGRAVHLARLAQEGAQYLTILCLRPELHHVFTQFCRELAESVGDAKSPAREAAAAFDRWRALFSEAGRRTLLSEQGLVGLLGELLMVENLLAHGAPGTLQFWDGPFNEVHDFRTRTHAIEVKTTLVREGRVVSISGIDQLQEPNDSDLVLFHLRLERDPGGFNLEAMAARVLSAGADHDQLDSRLRKVGVNPDVLTAYRDRRFRLRETRAYDVCGFAFPRIVRSSFTDGDIPAGTMRIGYAIDLTNEPPFPLTPQAADTVLVALAEEAVDAMDT